MFNKCEETLLHFSTLMCHWIRDILPVAQILQYISPISQNAHFVTEICTWLGLGYSVFSFKLVRFYFIDSLLNIFSMSLVWDYQYACDNYSTHWGRDKMDNISQTAFSNVFSPRKLFDSIKISFKFVPKGLIENNPTLAQIIGADQANCRLLNQWWDSLLTHICIPRAQWVSGDPDQCDRCWNCVLIHTVIQLPWCYFS